MKEDGGAEKTRRLAVIPARSGSKGFPHKNIALLAGKPLLQYSVEAALRSGLFDCVHVSTDAETYAEIGRAAGADVPFLRPAELAGDQSDSWSVLREVVKRYEARGQEFDEVVLLQPTSPLRDAADVRGAAALYREKGGPAVISLCPADHPPLWMNTLPENRSLRNFLRPEYAELRRQDIPEYYRLNGAIYWMSTELLKSGEDILSRAYAYVMSPEHSIDIDTAYDFAIAEASLRLEAEKGGVSQ